MNHSNNAGFDELVEALLSDPDAMARVCDFSAETWAALAELESTEAAGAHPFADLSPLEPPRDVRDAFLHELAAAAAYVALPAAAGPAPSPGRAPGRAMLPDEIHPVGGPSRKCTFASAAVHYSSEGRLRGSFVVSADERARAAGLERGFVLLRLARRKAQAWSPARDKESPPWELALPVRVRSAVSRENGDLALSFDYAGPAHQFGGGTRGIPIAREQLALHLFADPAAAGQNAGAAPA